MDTIDSKTLDIWLHHLQDETDASYLYKILAGLEKDERKKNIYAQLSDVEERHKDAWLDLLTKNNVSSIKVKPSGKAKFNAFLSRRFGTGFLSKMMLEEEGLEVKSYLGLYNDSTSAPTKEIALRLAKDSAEHSGKLSELLDKTGESWHKTSSGGTLRNVVYGFNDGLTANFGLIAGVIGANVEAHVILISGIAGMMADALSMGASGYLAAVSERDVYEHEKKMEAEEIKMMPELETEELALIYEAKGMSKEESKKLAAEIISDPELALKEQVREELGISESTSSPFREGWITGLSTAIGSFIPVLPFLILKGPAAIWTSIIILMISHFAVGASRSIFTGRGIIRSGFDMFVVGFGVAALGYLIGNIISLFL
jgi:VIT1/CCC1 family predicted Fe2+/Mn2+ transporter/rubrerythrin